MDLPTLPTHSFTANDSYSDPHNTESASGNTGTPAMNNSGVENESAVDNNSQKIDSNAIILAEALSDKTISWRIHNCKIIKKIITQDLPLPFLYHYDSLEDSIKATYPLTPKLLAQFNTPMTAVEAAKFIGIDKALITSPWHVKVIGSLVVFSEALQLAVRLHWTNTGKDTQQIYTQNEADAITAAFKDWQFFGRVDILYKNTKQTLISIDEHGTTEAPLLTIEASADYQQLLATHALTVIAKLEADKTELPWFDDAILARLE
ncbi:MAG: hypothetical protein ACI9JO_001154 [Psychrobacter okhotskensis]|jgi:hypothetical protein|uniref:hypothetical protein n=1 Tax=Psychrobacter TaxID=497 RepID=UPI000C32F8E8|nr:hypothetical protein [Psychrobacter sp. Sarcosine-3u-12]PKG36305.1 hypothetical protein CXF65_03370 [Psychrobacter sp. Sarcosine-3u-12]